MWLLNFKVGYKEGQRKLTISHSNLHFLGAVVPLPQMCHRLISSNRSSHCQGIHLVYSRNPGASKTGHTTSSTKPSGVKRPTTFQRAAGFILSCCRSTTQHFKTATFHHQLYQEFQPTFCSLCHRKRRFTQNLRPF